jgi:predicted Zn finger-like uncharacterized protein
VNVSCPECRSVFRVDPTKVPSTTVRARCSVCGGVITVTAGSSIEDEFAANPSPARSEKRENNAASAQRGNAGLSMAMLENLQAPPTVPRSPTPAPSLSAVQPSAKGRAPAPEANPAPPVARPLNPPAAAAPGTVVRPVLFPPRPMMPGAAPASGGMTARAIVAPRAPAPAPAATSQAAPSTQLPAAAPASAPRPITAGNSSAPAATHVNANNPTPSLPPRAPAAAPLTSATGAPTPTRSPINPFLANDPHAKAKRLARALVSDLVTYFPQKRQDGLRDGTLKQLFKDEIQKSYEEYVQQVGREFAESTPHFQEALNDLLAGGQTVF